MQPKVSVVIPVYNVEKYIEKCLDSVLRQTLAEIEVICVDDGSTDSTPEILSRYAAMHSNLHIERQKNAGSSVARNRGVDLATGDYILFVDSDDWLIGPDALELLYARAASLNVDELYFSACGSYESDALAQKYASEPYGFHGSYPQDEVLSGQQMFVKQFNSGDFLPSIWRRLYRRAFLCENHLRFVEGIVHQDYMFSMECIALAQRAACWDICCYNRHMRPDSITTSSNQFKSMYARLIGSRSMLDFSRKRLDGADPTFLACFTRRIQQWVRENVWMYSNLSPQMRREFWRWVPDSRRSELRSWMRADRIRWAPYVLRRRLRSRLSPELRARIRKLMPGKPR